MDSRRINGLEIAATQTVKRDGNAWVVPSQSNHAPYRVSLIANTCTCAAHDLSNRKCKHIFAAEYTAKRDGRLENYKGPEIIQRPTYSQNWKAYNAAQTNEKGKVSELLKGLCEGIVEPPQKMGRPRMPLKDAVFAAVMKVYGTQSGRRTTCDLNDCGEKGLLEKVPHYNTIFKYLEDPKLTAILKAMIEESAMPLKAVENCFAVDSTGFATCVYDRWFDEKYGKSANQKTFLKVHLTCGVKTNVVTSVEITDASSHDNTQFEALVNSTASRFRIKELSADKAYLSKDNFDLILAHGATPYIPFKSNTTGEGPKNWRKLFHFFHYHRPEFEAHYHQRSNVESTMWMIKSKFGASIRSKLPASQENELLCKVLCHNLSVLVQSIYELGVNVEFWREAA